MAVEAACRRAAHPPGEHDVTDGVGAEYFARFGAASKNRGYYSFDHAGVHVVALVNVMQFKPGGLASLGDTQLAWLEDDLAGRPSSQPIVLFAHMPMWSIYDPWGWGSSDTGQILALVRRFGSVTILNGHIHQIISKVEGNVTFHTARATAYPQPAPGVGPGPGPLDVPADQLPRMLGITSVGRASLHSPLRLADATLA
ncbi:MAG TPA: metallophosphoesterase [Caulobacteraceae bacterium]|nr:metallophosphoesterase [Caulobacteraceae bacterium]